MTFHRGITGRSSRRESLVGTLERDRLKWNDHVTIGGVFVRFWIWDALARLMGQNEGKKVRIVIEVVDD